VLDALWTTGAFGEPAPVLAVALVDRLPSVPPVPEPLPVVDPAPEPEPLPRPVFAAALPLSLPVLPVLSPVPPPLPLILGGLTYGPYPMTTSSSITGATMTAAGAMKVTR
jgi:hypothetical protein